MRQANRLLLFIKALFSTAHDALGWFTHCAYRSNPAGSHWRPHNLAGWDIVGIRLRWVVLCHSGGLCSSTPQGARGWPKILTKMCIREALY